MLPSEVLITISVCMLSDNIRPSAVTAVAFDSLFVTPSAQIERGSSPCDKIINLSDHLNIQCILATNLSYADFGDTGHAKIVLRSMDITAILLPPDPLIIYKLLSNLDEIPRNTNINKCLRSEMPSSNQRIQHQ